MYALRLRINDDAPIVGGADDLGVLAAIINCTGKLGPSTAPHREDQTQDLFVSLGGLTSRAPGATDEHLNWLAHTVLKPGDRVLVEIIETDTADPVESGVEAEKRQDDEREYFEHCKAVTSKCAASMSLKPNPTLSRAARHAASVNRAPAQPVG